MSDNPYESPRASAEELADSGGGAIDVGECLRVAWSCTWATFPLWLGVLIVYFVLGALSVLACVVPAFLVVPALMWGGTKFLLNVLDGKEEFNDLFLGFQDFGARFPQMLIVLLLQLLISIPGQLVSTIGQVTEVLPLIMVGSLINLVWMFAVTIRLSFAPFYVVDQGLEGVDAMKASWEATSMQKGNLILLALLAFVVSLIGLVALLVGIIPATMIIYMMWAVAFRQLEGAPDEAREPSPQY